MTLSLPASLSAAASPAGKSTSAPAKGLATAPGQNKPAPGAEQATGVAEMFAALVATLTQQMQPANDATAPGSQAATVEGAPVAAVVTAVPGEVTVDDVVELASDVAPTAALAEIAADADGARAAVPATPADDGMPAEAATPAVAGGKLTNPGAEYGASPATPAVPGEGGEPADAATPATRAPAAPPTQPVQPQAGLSPAAIDVTSPPVHSPTADPALGAVPATPAPAAQAVEHAAPTSTAARTTPPDPHVQVARVVRPLRLGDDGAYQLALDLTPAELGRVRIDVELRGSTIHLALRADNPATRELLQDSLQQLRNELETAGLNAGSLDVGSHGANGRGAARAQHGGAASHESGTAAAANAPATATPADLADADLSAGLNVLA